MKVLGRRGAPGRAGPPVEVDGDGRFVVPRREFVPAYLRTWEEGRLREKIDEALEALRSCTLCPRDCEVDRLGGKFAVCKTGRHARVSSHFPHFGEEDVLRGWRGSGTIFFAWCNLRCVFCLSPDVRVLTDHGTQPIEKIFSLGTDELAMNGGTVRFLRGVRAWTRQGKLAPISKAFSHHYRGAMVVLKPHELPPLAVTPNHAVFAALGPRSEVTKVPAGSLTVSHFLVASEPRERRHPARRKGSAVLAAVGGGTPGRDHDFQGDDAVPANARVREAVEAIRVPIREISRIWHEGPVYNLEVDDPDHSYVASGVAVVNCQNFETSQDGEGEVVGPEALARMMLELQARGCHNINFVTPEHVVPQILEALPHAIEGGLRLPIVYNTSAYDSLHSIRLMDGVADVYMPDFKLWDRERCRRYLLAPDYADAAREVIRAMHEQVGELRVSEEGLAIRGVLVRHLVMPGMREDTRAILHWLAGLSRDTYVNVMDQYYPAWKATSEKYREIGRRIHPEELEAAYASARVSGLWRLDQRWRRVLGPAGA